MIDEDPSNINGAIMVIADSETELYRALDRYKLEDQDGAVFSKMSDVEGRKVVVVKRFGDYLGEAERYLARFPKS